MTIFGGPDVDPWGRMNSPLYSMSPTEANKFTRHMSDFLYQIGISSPFIQINVSVLLTFNSIVRRQWEYSALNFIKCLYDQRKGLNKSWSGCQIMATVKVLELYLKDYVASLAGFEGKEKK